MSFAKRFATSAALAGALSASPLLMEASSAATLTIDNGSAFVLQSNYNPDFVTPGAAPGTTITTFGSATTSLDGLFVNPNVVQLQITYMGFEAGDTDKAYVAFDYAGTPIFVNQTSTAGTSVLVSVTAPNGLVPFTFYDSGTNVSATNGGAVDPSTHIAFLQLTPDTVYAFFDDGGGSPTDADYDDMVVKITAIGGGGDLTTPIPGALPLFVSGLGIFGFAARRRKQKALAAKAA